MKSASFFNFFSSKLETVEGDYDFNIFLCSEYAVFWQSKSTSKTT
ncbi:hypothetical protein [Pseudoalteromonas sp. S4488]|nr:hypothetical protein [Pseudoalteromonas sp. S4488]